MRIIVTKLGKETAKTLSGENLLNDQSKLLNNIETTKNERSKPLSPVEKSKMIRNSSSKGTKKRNPFQISETEASLSLKPDKMVTVRQKKLSMPKNLADKYLTRNDYESRETSDKNKVNFILPNLPDKLFPNGEEELPKSFSLKKIFGDQIINELKLKMKNDKRMKDRHFVMSPNTLRSPIVLKSPYEILDEELDTIIETNNMNLIKYLSSKNFSEKSIHKIANYDEDRKIRMNKLCQIAEHNDDKLKSMLLKIQQKISTKHNAVKGEFKEEIDALKGGKALQNRIIANYPTKVIKKDLIYHDQLKDIHRIWKNLHLSRYCSRMRRNKSMNNEYFDKSKNVSKYI